MVFDYIDAAEMPRKVTTALGRPEDGTTTVRFDRPAWDTVPFSLSLSLSASLRAWMTKPFHVLGQITCVDASHASV